MEEANRTTAQLSVAAIFLGLAALSGAALAWAADWSRAASVIDKSTVALALCLLIGLIASYHFPIHVRVSSKVYMGSVVLLLMAVLLPPALAATVAGLGSLLGELSVRSRTGNNLQVVVAQGTRWCLLVLAASCVANVGPPSFDKTGVLPNVAAAVVLWIGDMVTFLLIYYPITRERPLRMLREMAIGGGTVEAAQYLVGLIGAFETSRGLWTLALLCLPIGLVYMAFKNSKEMHDETRKIIENTADLVDMRDPYTGEHSRRVAELAAAILRQLGKVGPLARPDVRLIVSAARVHDIGKIGIPDEILRKDGNLTEDEWAIMRMHPEKGAELLERYPNFARGVEIIRHHHERWDGHGYPHRLAGPDIPFGSRVIAVADSFDAMTSDRPFRRAMSPDVAAAILREGRGTQWDPQVVDALLRAIDDRLTGSGAPPIHVLRPSDEPISETA